MNATAGSTHRNSAESLLRTSVAEGRLARLRVFGSCMAPLINHGDFVLVECVTLPLPPGSIVVAKNADGDFVCHRVLSRSDHVPSGSIWLSGDQHGVLEAHPMQSIVGRVCGVEQGDKTLQLPDVPRTADSTLARLQLFALRRRGTFFGRGAAFLHRTLARTRIRLR